MAPSSVSCATLVTSQHPPTSALKLQEHLGLMRVRGKGLEGSGSWDLVEEPVLGSWVVVGLEGGGSEGKGRRGEQALRSGALRRILHAAQG